MRIVGIVVALVLLSAAASSSNGKSAVTAGRKVSSEAAATSKGVPGGWEGGETIETAVVIPSLPFTGTGNTCDFVDDYDEVCPYDFPTSPDCVYAFTPDTTTVVDLFLCMSDYDTKIYLYENAYTPGMPFICNDDNTACRDHNAYVYQSWIEEAWLYAGNTYYIVIDGYGGDCGNYVLEMYEPEPCIVECPPGALLEGEMDCCDGYVDNYNGGCQSTPSVFQYIDPLNDTIRIYGTSGVYERDGEFERDTDWYILSLADPHTVTVGVEAEFDVLLGLVDMSGGCDEAGFYPAGSTVAEDCNHATLSVSVPAGETSVFVSTASWNPRFTCGSNYVLTIDGYHGYIPVERRSWGSIKALYR